MTGTALSLPPVAKVSNGTGSNLFWPISLASVVCKLLEAILKTKLLDHLSQLDLLTPQQNGSFPRRSTLTNVLVAEKLVTKWLNQGNAVDLIYLGCSEAFDLVNHQLILA